MYDRDIVHFCPCLLLLTTHPSMTSCPESVFPFWCLEVVLGDFDSLTFHFHPSLDAEKQWCDWSSFWVGGASSLIFFPLNNLHLLEMSWICMCEHKAESRQDNLFPPLLFYKQKCPGEDSWTSCDSVLYVPSYCVKRPSLMLWFMLNNMFGKQSRNTWRKWFKAVRSPNRFRSKPTSTWTLQNPLELDLELWPRALVDVAYLWLTWLRAFRNHTA